MREKSRGRERKREREWKEGSNVKNTRYTRRSFTHFVNRKKKSSLGPLSLSLSLSLSLCHDFSRPFFTLATLRTFDQRPYGRRRWWLSCELVFHMLLGDNFSDWSMFTLAILHPCRHSSFLDQFCLSLCSIISHALVSDLLPSIRVWVSLSTSLCALCNSLSLSLSLIVYPLVCPLQVSIHNITGTLVHGRWQVGRSVVTFVLFHTERIDSAWFNQLSGHRKRNRERVI